MPQKAVLILGGTTEANDLADLLTQTAQFNVTTSRAGVTQKRKAVSGAERVGGFGGTEGLKNYLRQNQIAAVIDATHPFAQTMTAHAFDACQDLNLPHIILSRPEWIETQGDNWIKAPTIETALEHIRALKHPARILITTGQKELESLTQISQHHYLARMIEKPTLASAPNNLEILLERGPFVLEDEIRLLRDHAIDFLLSKNSGGEATEAKIIAARACHVPVLMVSRPALPPAVTLQSPEEVQDWLQQTLLDG